MCDILAIDDDADQPAGAVAGGSGEFLPGH